MEDEAAAAAAAADVAGVLGDGGTSGDGNAETEADCRCSRRPDPGLTVLDPDDPELERDPVSLNSPSRRSLELPRPFRSARAHAKESRRVKDPSSSPSTFCSLRGGRVVDVDPDTLRRDADVDGVANPSKGVAGFLGVCGTNGNSASLLRELFLLWCNAVTSAPEIIDALDASGV